MRWLASLRARTLLLIGWLGFFVYANPGLMSYDSVQQLVRARTGTFTDDHPPMMSVLWAITDFIVPGPLGMLVLQSTCFLAGAYLLLRRLELSERRAAVLAVALLWFPPISSVMAVIWKDAQMAGLLLLGTALITRTERRPQLAGLLFLLLATTMRYNAFALTFPLVVLLYAPTATHMRYPLALVAWVAITGLAMMITTALPILSGAEHRHLWHESMALADIVGTVRFADDLRDAALLPDLAGVPLRIDHDIQDATRTTFSADDIPPQRLASFGGGQFIPGIWITTDHVFRRPTTDAERAAVSHAWKAIVLGHPGAYATYRTHVAAERLGITGAIPSATYVWFTNVVDIEGSTRLTEHSAAPSTVQRALFAGMLAIGTSVLFRPIVYLVLALVLLPLVRRRRVELALLASGLLGEAALLVISPTVDYRYSFWLVIATLVVAAVMVARVVARRQQALADTAS